MASGVSYYTLIITHIMTRIRHIVCAPSCIHSVYIVYCNVQHCIYILTSLYWGPRTNNNRSLLNRLISSFGSSFNYRPFIASLLSSLALSSNISVPTLHTPEIIVHKLTKTNYRHKRPWIAGIAHSIM